MQKQKVVRANRVSSNKKQSRTKTNYDKSDLLRRNSIAALFLRGRTFSTKFFDTLNSSNSFDLIAFSRRRFGSSPNTTPQYIPLKYLLLYYNSVQNLRINFRRVYQLQNLRFVFPHNGPIEHVGSKIKLKLSFYNS